MAEWAEGRSEGGRERAPSRECRHRWGSNPASRASAKLRSTTSYTSLMSSRAAARSAAVSASVVEGVGAREEAAVRSEFHVESICVSNRRKTPKSWSSEADARSRACAAGTVPMWRQAAAKT